MEAQFKNESIISLLATTKLVFYTVLEFLNPEELENLYLSLKQTGKYNHTAVQQIIQAYVYIRTQMMNTDRSYYFAVYDDSRFRNLEKRNLAFLVQSNNQFNRLFQQRQETNKFIKEILVKADCQYVLNQIQQIYMDPDVPMLRLLRENVGVGCTSAFQNFLVSMSQELYSMPLEEYPNLSEFYQKRSQQSYINQFFKIGRSKGRHPDFQKVKKLRLAAYLIKAEQISSHELAQNQLHNFLIGLFGLADQMVEASAVYLDGIEDPYYRFMEFCFRYSIYRNFVLMIQDKFAFAFDIYSNLYEDYFESEAVDIPTFSFWRPAYSKWLIKMSKFHKEMTSIYNHYVLKTRYETILTSLQKLPQKQRPQQYSVVRNWIKSQSQSQKIQTLAQLHKPINTEIFEIIQEQLVFCINQYNDMMIDVSVDQVTVHWCGYTRQKLGEVFLGFQKQVMQANLGFYQGLFQVQASPALTGYILDADLNQIQNKQYYKHKLTSQIAHQATTTNTSINPSILTFKLQNLDELIQDYNSNSNLLQQIPDEQSRKLHQLLPPPQEQIMKYMEKPEIQTMDVSDQGESQLSDIQYHSDSQLEFPESKKAEIQSFMRDQGGGECGEQSQGAISNYPQITRCL